MDEGHLSLTELTIDGTSGSESHNRTGSGIGRRSDPNEGEGVVADEGRYDEWTRQSASRNSEAGAESLV